MWCATAAMARDIRAALCPLSAIQEVPRIAMGSEDTNVYVLNIAGACSKQGAACNGLYSIVPAHFEYGDCACAQVAHTSRSS